MTIPHINTSIVCFNHCTQWFCAYRVEYCKFRGNGEARQCWVPWESVFAHFRSSPLALCSPFSGRTRQCAGAGVRVSHSNLATVVWWVQGLKGSMPRVPVDKGHGSGYLREQLVSCGTLVGWTWAHKKLQTGLFLDEGEGRTNCLALIVWTPVLVKSHMLLSVTKGHSSAIPQMETAISYPPWNL